MHPRNVPIIITVSLIMGIALTYLVVYNGLDYINLAIALTMGTCGYLLSWVINKRDVITSDQFRIILNGIKSEMHAHRQDHDIRAYDPKAVGTRISALTASVKRLDDLIRSRISKRTSD